MRLGATLVALFFGAVLAALLGCSGGGGPSSSGPITPAPVPRTDLLFGYYGQDSLTVNETAPHANLYWAAEFYGPGEQMAGLTQAIAAGMRTVIPMPLCHVPPERGEEEARFWLKRLHAAGLLKGAAAVAWCDEPNTSRSGAWSDAQAVAMTAAVRRAMAGFPDTASAAVVVIYACAVAGRPGITAADWPGCDDYEKGCGLLRDSGPVDDMRRGLGSEQRLVLLPGGASPWRQDPACFMAYAHAHPEVVAVVAFLWQSVTDEGSTYPGIRTDPTMRRLYCEAARPGACGT
jgi:hypothetical protein